MRWAGYTIYELFGMPRRTNTTESVWGIVIGLIIRIEIR